MRPDARAWFESRTTSATSLSDIDAEALLRAKRRGGHRISVVLPARDEEATVGRLVADLRRRWVRDVPLVDELVVMDSDSTDGTGEVAAAAGADVVRTADVLPAQGTRPGKGEALWESLAATTGDLLVFMDADLLGDVAHYVPGLLGPLLADPSVQYVKGCYTRPLVIDGLSVPAGGGRVTELTARPLRNALWPELAGFVQPLGGEYAGRRAALEQVPFVSGYGVEVGLLVDLLELAGLVGLAQVDLAAAGGAGRDGGAGGLGGAGPGRGARTSRGQRAAHPVPPRRHGLRTAHDDGRRRRAAARADGSRVPRPLGRGRRLVPDRPEARTSVGRAAPSQTMSGPAAPTSSACPGCGAVLADGPAPERLRPGASAACARLLEDTLRGLRDDVASDAGAAATLRVAEDTYAAQHLDPGAPQRVQEALDRLGAHSGRHSAPPTVWQTTIADVAADLDVIELQVLVDRWARTVVEDWSGVPLSGGRLP